MDRPGLPAGPFGDYAPRGGASHIRFRLLAARSQEAATQKARPMLAPSTVPIAPHPARSKEGQHCGPLLPLPDSKCNSKGLLAIANRSRHGNPSG